MTSTTKNVRVHTNNQEDNLQVFTFTLTSDLLKVLQSPEVEMISMKVDNNNKYHMILHSKKDKESFDCTTLSEKENTELYCIRKNRTFSQVGNITHKLNVSTNVSQTMSKRILQTTTSTNRKANKIMPFNSTNEKRNQINSNVSFIKGNVGSNQNQNNFQFAPILQKPQKILKPEPTRIGMVDEGEESSEEQSDSSEEEREREKQRNSKSENEEEIEEEEEVEENELIRECRRFLETVKNTSLMSTELAKKMEEGMSEKVKIKFDEIRNPVEYYQARSFFFKKYEVYELIDNILEENKILFETLVEYYNKIPEGKFEKLKERVERKIMELHETREAEVKNLHESFNLYHVDIKKLKFMIEIFVKEEKRKKKK